MYRIILLFIFASSCFAGNYKPNEIDNELIHLSFNDKFKEAKDLAQKQINLNPDIPKYYYYKINAMVLEYFERITAIDIDKRSEGRKRINEELIAYFEEVADKFEDRELDLENKFYYGTILGYLARMQGLDGSWWSAFRTGMESQEIMEEIIEEDPNFYDAYLLLGMFEYYADRLSGVIGVIASVLGFSGDRDTGIEYLMLALEKGRFTFGQTSLTLVEIFSQLEDNEYKAIPYYEKFVAIFPGNRRLINSYVHKLINTWDLKKAEDLITNDNNDLIDAYTKARYYNRAGNSELAIEFAAKAMENKNRNWRGVNHHSRFIYTLENYLIGNISEADSSKNKLADYLQHRFNMVVENKNDALWLRKLSRHIIEKDDSAIQAQIKNKPVFSDTTDFQVQFYSLIGDYHFRQGLYESAVEYYKNIAKSDGTDLKYYAYKQLVEVYLRTETQEQNVKWLIDQIDEFDNDRLSFRARDLEKKYKL